MRVRLLPALVALALSVALPAAAQGWFEGRDASAVAAWPARHHADQVGCLCQEAVVTPPEAYGRTRQHSHSDAWRGADGDRSLFADDGRGHARGAVYREAEDRLGWDDREPIWRAGGLHADVGEARWRIYPETRERAWAPGEHWIGDCGCRPAGPSDDSGFVVWPS